jgi:hypothetical protein
MRISSPKSFEQGSVAPSKRAIEMTRTLEAFADARAQQLLPRSASGRPCPAIPNMAAARWAQAAMLLVVLLFGAETKRPALADGLTRGTGAYYRGDYARAGRELNPAI